MVESKLGNSQSRSRDRPVAWHDLTVKTVDLLVDRKQEAANRPSAPVLPRMQNLPTFFSSSKASSMLVRYIDLFYS